MKTYKQRNKELEAKNKRLQEENYLRVQETLLYKETLAKDQQLDIIVYYDLKEKYDKAISGLQAIKYISSREKPEWQIADQCLWELGNKDV